MPLVAPWSKVTCPYCFEQFHLSKTPRRLVGPGISSAPDEAIKRYFGMDDAPLLGEVKEPRKPAKWSDRFFVPREAMNERRICPHDHIFLPDKIASGETSGEYIAVIGARDSGKSNYFGVLMNALRRKYMEQLSFEVMDADTYGPTGRLSTADLYRERYWQYLFDPAKPPEAVPQTQPVREAAVRTIYDPRIPLIYMFRFQKRYWHHFTRPLAHRIPVYFMIYDAAGEGMTNAESLHFCKFIRRATGIIFMIDPFDYPGLRAQLPENVQKRLRPPAPRPSEIVDRVINEYWGEGRSAARRIDIPVAFALTKSDLFGETKDVLYPGSQILRDSSHHGGFDRAGCEDLHREIVECIKRWESAELIIKAQGFTTHRFFALSALGSAPNADKKLEKVITPRRIADPLLWLFWLRGYIPEAPKSSASR
jgi:hypothetical protein